MKAEDREKLIQAMIAPEHRIWLSRRLVEGWELADKVERHLRRHTDIRPFHTLAESEKAINHAIIESTIQAIEHAGYCLVKSPQPEREEGRST